MPLVEYVEYGRSGTYYDSRTHPQVREILERLRCQPRTRVRLSYGNYDPADPNFGRDWLHEYGVCGYVGRSSGPQRIPILLHNARSMGGASIRDYAIVRIASTTRPHTVLWQHPAYHVGELVVYPEQNNSYPFSVYRDGENLISFQTFDQLQRWWSTRQLPRPIRMLNPGEPIPGPAPRELLPLPPLIGDQRLKIRP